MMKKARKRLNWELRDQKTESFFFISQKVIQKTKKFDLGADG